jgi:hypothetical protein
VLFIFTCSSHLHVGYDQCCRVCLAPTILAPSSLATDAPWPIVDIYVYYIWNIYNIHIICIYIIAPSSLATDAPWPIFIWIYFKYIYYTYYIYIYIYYIYTYMYIYIYIHTYIYIDMYRYILFLRVPPRGTLHALKTNFQKSAP